MTTKPILFLSTSGELSKPENINNFQYIGRVLNASKDGLIDSEVATYNGDFIVVNATKQKELQYLRLINLDMVVRVCVLRKYESAKQEWIQNHRFDYIIKEQQLPNLKNCKNKQEVLNFLKFLDATKKQIPSDLKFLWEKIKAFIPLASFVFHKYT